MMQAILKRVRLLADRQSSLSVSYLLYTATLGFSGAIQLGLLFLLARLLPPQEFGVATLLMVSIPLACRFVTLGSDIGLSIRTWKQPRAEQKADLSAVLTWTGVTVLVLLSLLPVVGYFAGNTVDLTLVGCALLAAAFRSYAEVFQFMLRREGQVAQVGLIVIVRAILLLGMCLSALFVVGNSALAYLVGALVAEGVTALWALGHLHRLYGLHLFAPGSFTRVRGLVRVGFPIIPSTAAALLLAAGDRFMITALLGLAATGVYALGQRLAESMVQILFVPFVSAFGPVARKVASEDEGRALALIADTAQNFAFVGGAVVAFVAIFGNEIIYLFAGPDHASAATVFLLIAAAVLVYQVSQTLGAYFSHTEQLHKYMWIVILGAGLNILFNFVFVPVFGIVGAAMASLLVCEAMLITIVVVARSSGAAIASLRRLHLPFLLLGAYLALVYGIDQAQPGWPISISAKAGLWMAYVGLCIAVSHEIRMLIARVAGRVRVFLAL